MLKAISTFVHVRERLHPGILDRLVTGGAAGIEVFAHTSHFDYTNPQQVREIAAWFRSQPGAEFASLHVPIFAGGEWGRFDSPALDIAGRERKERIAAMDEIKRAIEVAEAAPFRYLIVHVGVPGVSYDERQFEGALSSVEHLHAFARPLGVRLLLENITNDITAPEKLLELIRTLHYDDIGVCLDTGHAHLEPGVAEAIQALSAHIRSVHVHDNRGLRDEHLWPGEGSIDWPRTMELLRAAPQVPALVLEIGSDPAGDPDFGKVVPGLMHAAWEKLGQ